MNENKIGLGNDNIRLIKKDEELVSAIITHRKLKEDDTPMVSDMMRYNMWTMAQFGDLTGYKPSTLTNMTRPSYGKEGDLKTELDFCYPFQSISSQGPKFILRNEKSEKMLTKV